MLDWMNPLAFLQTLVRVAVVWFAFYGAGKMLREPLKIDRAFPLLPSEIVGMLAFVVLTIPLSILGVMNRTVCPIIILVCSIPGLLFVYGNLKRRLALKRPPVLQILFGLFFVFVLILNFTYASMPNIGFDDPLITYAVQPDRWLNSGRIYWLEETAFSGFPLLYEMTAVWPASLSTDRMNQLSLLQVFQLTVLLLSLFRGLQILKVSKRFWFPVSTIVLLTTAIYYWCSLAKSDTIAVLFCTLALASAIRQKETGFEGSPLSSWLFMGLALAVKQTAAIVLVPFALYSAGSFFKYSAKWKALALASLIAVPLAYGGRTMLKTGSPTYPFYPLNSLLRDEWHLQRPEEQTMINSRSSYVYESKNFSPEKHIGIFFGAMEGTILLLLAGLISTVASKKRKDAVLTIPMFGYFAIAIASFWPPWWGYKYSILVYPLAALLGGKLLSPNLWGKMSTSAILIASFFIPGFVVAAVNPFPFHDRLFVTESIFSGEWDPVNNYRVLRSTPENRTHMWANSMFSSETVIFSIHEEKRYFFDGTIIVGWRHPLAQKLYLDNSLDEELAILDSLNIDYIGFYRNQPTILEQENKLAMLDYIGVGNILEPVVIIDGNYLICRYNPF